MELPEELYGRYADYVYRYLQAKTHDAALAEELTQETFCQAVRTIDRYNGSCAATTWLCGIAKNVLLTYRRKHPAVLEFDGDAPVSTASQSEQSPEELMISHERRVSLLSRLHSLDDPYREVVYLRVFGSLSFKEVGEILGRTETWARVTFYRAKDRLRRELETHER